MPFEDLFSAIEQGDLAGVNQILAADPEAGRARNAEGLTPIMVAAYWGRTEVLNRLVEVSGQLDFWEAATVGAVDTVRELSNQDPELITARSVDGFTALHLAVFFGNQETALALIDAGSDVLARTHNVLDNQPLHAAAAGNDARSRLPCVRALLEAGAAVNERQSGGFTPLMSAAQNGDEAVVDLLLAAGADPKAKDDRGLTASEHATNAGYPEIATRLAGAPGSSGYPQASANSRRLHEGV